MKNRQPKVHLTRTLLRDNGGWFLLTVVCMLISVGLDFITPLLLGETVDHYLTDGPSRLPEAVNRFVEGLGGVPYMRSHLWIIGVLIVALALVGGLFSFLKGRFQAVAGENTARWLRDTLYTHLQRLPFSWHAKAQTGDLVQRCTSDVETVRRFLSTELLSIISCVLNITVALYYLLRENALLTLYSTLAVPALFLFSFFFFKWIVKRFGEADAAEGKMSAVLQEDLTGVRVVRAFGRQEYERVRFYNSAKDLRDKSFRLNILFSLFWSGGDLISTVQTLAMLVLCIVFAARGDITVGTVVIFSSYLGRILWPIRQLGRTLGNAGKCKVAVRRISEILAAPTEPAEPGAQKPPLDKDIVFDHVSFAYEDGTPVLRDVSFTLPQGKTTAILGATGSGKSTIALLLQRLYQPSGGRILAGDVDLQQIDRAYLRSHVGLILQEPFLYSKTLRENVGITSPDLPEDAVRRAARDACALEFIEKSDEGWNTLVGERGVTLSGGQKQRIAIARTLLKDNRVLIFDDSLSAVDTETDRQIRQALEKQSRPVTTLIISHRITTLSRADQILVLEDGRITECGTHEQLIHSGGLYSRIYAIQAASLTPDNGESAKPGV